MSTNAVDSVYRSGLDSRQEDARRRDINTNAVDPEQRVSRAVVPLPT